VVDSNLLTAIVTSVCTAGSTAGVAITALLVQSKRMDRVEGKLDKIDLTLEMLTGAMHELDKRVSVIEDRIFRRDGA
jgi:hypothetical protein